MYMLDATGKQIATSIGNLVVDTSGLMTDVTGQAINASLHEIKNALTREVIYLYDRKTSAQGVSVEPVTHTSILQLSLTPGIWQISGTIVTPAGTGYRQCYIADDAASTSAMNTITTVMPAASGTITAVPVSGILQIDTNTTIYLRMRHNSGSALNVYGILNAVKM